MITGRAPGTTLQKSGTRRVEERLSGSCSVALNCIDVLNETAATGAHDGSIVMGRAAGGAKGARGHNHQSVSSVTCSRLAVSAGHDGRLCVWDVRGAATARQRAELCERRKCLCTCSATAVAGATPSRVHRFSAPGA